MFCQNCLFKQSVSLKWSIELQKSVCRTRLESCVFLCFFGSSWVQLNCCGVFHIMSANWVFIFSELRGQVLLEMFISELWDSNAHGDTLFPVFHWCGKYLAFQQVRFYTWFVFFTVTGTASLLYSLSSCWLKPQHQLWLLMPDLSLTSLSLLTLFKPILTQWISVQYLWNRLNKQNPGWDYHWYLED